MADSVGTPTVVNKVLTINKIQYKGTIAIGASPATYATGGIVTSFQVAGIQSSLPPEDVQVEGIAGFDYRFVPGTTIANGKLMIFGAGAVSTNAAIGVEHTVAAIVAGVSGDTITFRATFKKLR